jgi:Rap1a immunity proteins
MKMFVVALFATNIFTTAQAGFYTGNDIARQCLSNKPFVSGYVSGAVDKGIIDAPALYEFYIETFDSKNNEEKNEKINKSLGEASVAIEGYCIPKGATVGQTGDVFCKYLEENPAQRQKNAAELLGSALKAAWPCK